ncbi:MAG TPA: hypothetical protein VF595_16095 [Tepidisphaeraceae bacterium]|jgi:hypothetical protein
MANKANRYKLHALRKLRASLGLPFDHLYPWPQVVKRKTSFQLDVDHWRKITKEMNVSRPRYQRLVENVKKIRRLVRCHADTLPLPTNRADTAIVA